MTMSYTSNQAFPYPGTDEYFKDANDWLKQLAEAAEVHSVQRFTNQADLSTKRPTPSAGEFAWITDDEVLQVYTGSAWERVYPPQPMIYTGTTTPSSSLGAPGDLYIKTT
jgi:hypothetical protein